MDVKEYERKVSELSFELRKERLKYKELIKKYHKVADELLLIKAGKPIQRIKEDKDDNIRSK